MRRALLSLEACKVAECVAACLLVQLALAAADPSWHGCRYPFKPDQIIQNTDWELYIAQIAREIMSEQSPKALFQVCDTLPRARQCVRMR
jgi:hypothetical protein